MTPTREHAHWLAPWLTGATALYWLLMFFGTHISIPGPPSGNSYDKIAHFVGYAGLTLLAATALHCYRGFTVFTASILLFVILAYGAVDELTQMLVEGRSCELADWLADAAGAGCALALAAVFFRVLRSRRVHDTAT